MSETIEIALIVWRAGVSYPQSFDPMRCIRMRVDPEFDVGRVHRAGAMEVVSFLNENEIPHHYEYYPAKWDQMILNPARSLDPKPGVGYAIVLHLYDDDVAFDVRLRFNYKPLAQGWRDLFTQSGIVRQR